jgi:hypothetical protein
MFLCNSLGVVIVGLIIVYHLIGIQNSLSIKLYLKGIIK